jgi:hypothetical protein
MQGWCTANYMYLNINKTKIIKIINILINEYELCHSSIMDTETVNNVGVFLNSKLLFHNCINNIVTWTVKAVSSPCRAVPCRAVPCRAEPGREGRAAACSLLHKAAVNSSRQRCHGDDSTVLSYYVTGRCWAIVQ